MRCECQRLNGTEDGTFALSVFRNLGIDLVRPGENPSGEIADVLEAGLPKEFDGGCAATASLAVDDDLAVVIQLVYALRQIAEWDEVSADVGDLIFVRLANVEDKDIFPGIEAAF